jgi:hypothetical protein
MTRVYPTLRRALAAGLIALLVAVSVLPVATHAQLFEDPYCDPHPRADHGSPGTDDDVVVVAAEATDQHCDVCHWLRSLRVFDPAPVLLLAPAVQAVPARVDHAASPETASSALVAARAPPA